ncbi:MAG: CotH kinase family protein [Anaerolineales bacterium]
MKQLLIILVLILILISMTGCTGITQAVETIEKTIKSETAEELGEDIGRPEDWSSQTHSDDASPNYEVVFPQDKVNRIDINISSENWETMMGDMTDLVGTFGQGGGMGFRPGGDFQGNFPRNFHQDEERLEGDVPENMPENPDFPQGEMPQVAPPNREGNDENIPWGNELPEGGMPAPQGDNMPRGRMGMDFTDENPVWVSATIEFKGDVWEHVGIRFKGNSSLRSAWTAGNLKIPFKLDFDQFEDEYPKVDNQRFYGFKQLSLANQFSDASFLREKVTADVFRDFGVPSAHTAFYEVYVDYGEGPVYFGLYTMVEMVEDTVIETQFSSDEGNLYKPDGRGATFSEGSFTETSFDKETNQEEADYSDILALFDALHAESRLNDPVSWRKGLEAVFDVDLFLRWLAVNTVVQNWDTYGVMSHNYYLYTDPERGVITWIPWDNNMALSDRLGMGGRTLSLSLDEVSDDWPLIRFLMDDPIYKTQYEANLAEVVETAFEPEKMTEIYQYYHDLIAPYALAETEEATMLTSEAAFDQSLHALITQVKERYQAVQDYLSN